MAPTTMKHAEKYAALAALTGLPDLGTIVDPARLERLVAAAESMLAHATLECPLRYKVACKEHAEAAGYRLEHPEEIK